MYCKRCGKPVADYAAMCPSCGAMIADTALAGEEEVSIGDWLITLFLASIPLVGFIMVLVWAFSGGTNSSKQNWARAILIWGIILIVLLIVLGAASAALFAGALRGLA